MTPEEVMEAVARLCRKFKAKHVFLYGSRAKGTQVERSDIDIAVSGVSDFWGLLEEVEEIPTLYRIDQELLEDITKYGREI